MQKEIEAGKLAAKERTNERDLMQARCEKMKKGLQALLGQDDALAAPAQPATPVAAVSGGGL